MFPTKGMEFSSLENHRKIVDNKCMAKSILLRIFKSYSHIKFKFENTVLNRHLIKVLREWGSRDRISGDQNRRSKELPNFQEIESLIFQNCSGDRKGPRGLG
jgi:hypothetical protein